MRPMEHTSTDRQPSADPRRAQADGADTDERDPQIRSLILPDLVSADALIPAWLRRLFRRTDTPAAR
jgi:hypothetical protein